jgi:hypothetical protein
VRHLRRLQLAHLEHGVRVGNGGRPHDILDVVLDDLQRLAAVDTLCQQLQILRILLQNSIRSVRHRSIEHRGPVL